MSNIQKKFGKQIKKIREEKEMTQQTLADRMDVHRTYISKIENGEKNVTLQTMHQLSRTLRTPLETLFKRIK